MIAPQTHLLAKSDDLLFGLEVQSTSSFLHRNPFVRGLQASADFIAHSLDQNFHKHIVGWSGNVATSEEDLVVAAFHQILFQRQRVPNVFVGADNLLRQQLQFGVEFGDTILGQQKQQVQTDKLVFVLRFTNLVSAKNLMRSFQKEIGGASGLTCNRSSST